MQHAHFILKGFVSILIQVGSRVTEVGLVGREGMLGLPAALGSEIGAYRAVVRDDLSVHRVEIERLRQMMLKRRAFGAVMLRYMQAGVAQITHTAFASANLTIAERLARWLLMAHDRIEEDTVRVTHSTMSEALSVQRSGITLALRELQGEALIEAGHRAVRIANREGLMARTAGSYGPAERAYRQLLGITIARPT